MQIFGSNQSTIVNDFLIKHVFGTEFNLYLFRLYSARFAFLMLFIITLLPSELFSKMLRNNRIFAKNSSDDSYTKNNDNENIEKEKEKYRFLYVLNGDLDGESFVGMYSPMKNSDITSLELLVIITSIILTIIMSIMIGSFVSFSNYRFQWRSGNIQPEPFLGLFGIVVMILMLTWLLWWFSAGCICMKNIYEGLKTDKTTTEEYLETFGISRCYTESIRNAMITFSFISLFFFFLAIFGRVGFYDDIIFRP